MDEEPNHEEEIRKIYEDLKNGNYELWYENNENKKFITDEKPTIPTFVDPIKNYLHRPLG